VWRVPRTASRSDDCLRGCSAWVAQSSGRIHGPERGCRVAGRGVNGGDGFLTSSVRSATLRPALTMSPLNRGCIAILTASLLRLQGDIFRPCQVANHVPFQ